MKFLLFLVATVAGSSSTEWGNGCLNDWLLFERRLLVEFVVIERLYSLGSWSLKLRMRRLAKLSNVLYDDAIDLSSCIQITIKCSKSITVMVRFSLNRIHSLSHIVLLKSLCVGRVSSIHELVHARSGRSWWAISGYVLSKCLIRSHIKWSDLRSSHTIKATGFLALEYSCCSHWFTWIVLISLLIINFCILNSISHLMQEWWFVQVVLTSEIGTMMSLFLSRVVHLLIWKGPQCDSASVYWAHA